MKKLRPKRKKFLTSKIVKATQKGLKKKRRKTKHHYRKHQNNLHEAYQRSVEFIKKARQEITISPKNEIKLLEDTENAIDFISKLKSYRRAAKEVKTVIIDLRNVNSIDIGTISLMLSSVKELILVDIEVKGNLPTNKVAKQVFLDSGFLEHMNEVSKSIRNSMKVTNKKNLLLMLAKGKSESRKVGQCIRTGIEALTGKPNHYPPIYGIIQEMNGNSVEHAYKRKAHWLLGINHEQHNKKLIFTFTDNGFGIINSLKKRFNKNVFDKLNWHNDERILEGVFDKKYNSRFKKQYNRNKGLPVIKKAQSENKIKNLIVISNNSLFRVDRSETMKLSEEFSGTFYYWELDINTYKNGKNIN